MDSHQQPEYRPDDGKVLIYTNSHVSHRANPRKAKSVYSVTMEEAAALFNGLKAVLLEHYETPEWALGHKDWWDVQEHKIWKGIDVGRPVWASRGFACAEWKDAQALLEYLEGNNRNIILRVVRKSD